MFVENLTQIDFSYLHADRGLLGESWSVDLVLDGSLNEQGMICDFSVVKKRVKQWLDAHVDHCLLIAEQMANIEVQHSDARTTVNWQYSDGSRFQCVAPEQAICVLPVNDVTERTLARWCESQLLEQFGDGVSGVGLTLRPEATKGAFYHYSHGLQQHTGNCQRIAHGHRSRLMVYRNGERDSTLECEWAGRLRDSYIGTQIHLQDEIDGHYHFAYQAAQGEFELTLPQRVCYLMNSETTVEQIASHLAEVIGSECPDDQIEVRAFEGIGKGAIA